MLCGHSRLGAWQVLMAISLVITPLSAHGRHSLTRRHHHHNQSTVNKEALDTRMVLSDDSAEREHLIGAGLGAKLPLGSTKHHHSRKHVHLDFIEEDPPVGEELTAGGGGPDQPGNPMSDDVITVAFHSPAPDVVPSDAMDLTKVPKPQKQKGGDPTAWTLSDFYDLFPDDDLSALDTTPEPEPTLSPPADMEDENPLLTVSPAVPDDVKPNVESRPSSPVAPMPGPDKDDGLGLGGAMGADGCRLGFVRSGPGVCVSQCDTEPNFCFNGGVCTVVAGMGAFCRCNVQDYIWNKGTRCDWAVTEFQVMCVVVGVASFVFLLLFMIIVFFAKRLHRLKNENRRLRKRSKYRPQSSEPQTDGLSVSTTADGSQPNVRKLCDTPPSAPQAHTHNLAYYDNIICQRPSTASYTWEYKPRNPYNHFQDDPQKQDNAAKSPQAKEEGSMNILNSHSPKHENNRPASVAHDHGHTPNNTEEKNAEDGVTIGLEVLLPKEAKLHAETSPPLQYDVFLYKVANGGDAASPGQAPPSHSANSYTTSLHIPKSPKTPKKAKSPKVSKSSKSPKPTKEHPAIDREPLSGRHSSPGRNTSAVRHPSPICHSAPGCYFSPTCHPSSHHSPAQCKCMPTSSSTPPQLRRPRGRSQAPDSERSGAGRECQSGHLRPSPSSPHLTQPPPSPSSWVKYSPVSTRSLPPLS
ncbi:chondroitin sulfate proteoglycan 5 isoform X1 [Scophthalmus maximus]|uniref:Neural chondroitin sulphate proteoglycan cytoplasmic domain-containing protein n=1 Tax=Scophthalmus maximus TaxID=52904 RepID=A0A8D3AJ38_SCOMX|nr:chondroitin sulfate proteoglycan 5 isoform X1 [Scophthalmus maximus]